MTRAQTLLVVWFALAIPFVSGADTVTTLRLNLTVETPGNPDSRVTAWPAPEDIDTVPDVVSAAVQRAWQTLRDLSAASAAAALADDNNADFLPTPHVRQTGTDFMNKLRGTLSDRGFTFAAGLDEPEPLPSGKVRFAMGCTCTDGHDPLPCCFEIWIRTNLLPAGAPARRWPIRQVAASGAVQTLLQAQRGGHAAPAPAAREFPASFAVVVFPAHGEWDSPVSPGNTVEDRFAPIFAVAVAVAEQALVLDILAKPRTETDRRPLETGLRAAFTGWRLHGEVKFRDELHGRSDAAGQPGVPAWVLRLDDFNAVRQQLARIDELHLGTRGRERWEDFAKRETDAGTRLASLQQDRQDATDLLQHGLDRQHPWGEPRFASAADFQFRVAWLRQQPAVVAVEPLVEKTWWFFRLPGIRA